MPDRETTFYLRAIKHFGSRWARRRLEADHFERTPQAVLDEYDAQREVFRQEFLASDWTVDEFVMSEVGAGHGDEYLFASLVAGELRWGREPVEEIRRLLLDRIVQVVSEYGAESVMEIGCGTGRNLIHLK